MNEQQPVRELRSVRLREDEWVLAEAIASMGAGRSSAAQGIREALVVAEERLRRLGKGNRLVELKQQIAQERRRKRAVSTIAEIDHKWTWETPSETCQCRIALELGPQACDHVWCTTCVKWVRDNGQQDPFGNPMYGCGH